MDLALFRVDWEVLAELLVTIIVLAFFLERLLSLLFENRWFLRRFDGRGIKEPIAFISAFVLVRTFDFDALGVLFHSERPTWIGLAITAGVIAGGSKASVKLFQELMDIKSSAAAEVQASKAQTVDTKSSAAVDDQASKTQK